MQVGNECLPASDDAPPDAAPDAPPDALPDADPFGSEATSFAIDAAHNNAQPNDAVASPLSPRWIASFSGPVSYPLVVGGLVIVAAAEAPPNVRALNAGTGALVWGPVDLTERVTLAFDHGRVFALDQDGHLTALDAASGANAWRIRLQGESFYASPPVAIGGTVYVNGYGVGGLTYAVDELTGQTRWSHQTFDGSEGCVAVAAGVVYEAEACQRVSAWNALTGVQLWFHSTNCTGGGGAAPAVYGGLIWDRDQTLGDIMIDKHGHAIDMFASGTLPAFHAGTAFYQAMGIVSAVDIATNSLRWTFTGDGDLCTSPVVAGGGGRVFVASRSGNVYEVNESTGAQVSVHNVGSTVSCFTEAESMTLAEGHLLVPVGDTLVVY